MDGGSNGAAYALYAHKNQGVFFTVPSHQRTERPGIKRIFALEKSDRANPICIDKPSLSMACPDFVRLTFFPLNQKCVRQHYLNAAVSIRTKERVLCVRCIDCSSLIENNARCRFAQTGSDLVPDALCDLAVDQRLRAIWLGHDDGGSGIR